MSCPCNGDCCDEPDTHPLTTSKGYDNRKNKPPMDVYTTVCDNCGASCNCCW